MAKLTGYNIKQIALNKPKIYFLESEGAKAKISREDLQVREEIAEKFRAYGSNKIRYMRNFMPQIGCPNRCAFCSQNSAKTIVRMSDRSLKNVVSAIKTVVAEMSAEVDSPASDSLNKSLIGNRPDGGKSAVYPYLDTDIGSYPNLYNYVKYLKEDLKVPIIISTVGYSRLNKHLQAMHEHIVKDFPESIASITFSITPYTYGWTEAAELSGLCSRKDYNLDMANAIKTYAPLLAILGPGRKTFCIALRFKPEVFTAQGQMDEGYISGHHFVHIGPHLIVGLVKGRGPKISRVIGIRKRKPVFNRKPLPYLLATSDSLLKNNVWKRTAINLIKASNPLSCGSPRMRIKKVEVYKCKNTDGPYYAIDPTFKHNGHFEALHIYPRTKSRKVSGYNNAERSLLNEILRYKRKHGMHRREEFPSATWGDVDSVQRQLYSRAEKVGLYDSFHKNHIIKEIIPLVSSYIEILKQSGLSPGLFFHPHFTDDTGQITNRGRAIIEFHGLAGTFDAFMTPNEERTFDENLHSRPGLNYLLSPIIADHQALQKDNACERKISANKYILSLAPIEYNPTFRHTKQELSMEISGIESTAIPISEFFKRKMLPGISPRPHSNPFATAGATAAKHSFARKE